RAACVPIMAALFPLDVATDSAARRAALRLQDDHGAHLGAHEVALADHRPALWAGLFDTRRHVTRMKDVAPPRVAKRGGRRSEDFGWRRPTWTPELLCFQMQQDGWQPRLAMAPWQPKMPG